MTRFDVVSGPGFCEILLKKLDKKKERYCTFMIKLSHI